jgi:hypothetical protein
MFPQMSRLFESFTTQSARISSISTMYPEYVRLHIRIPSEQFTADPTRKLILRNGRILQLRVDMMLLELVRLQQHLPLHDPAAAVTVV